MKNSLILLIDDDNNTRQATALILNYIGYPNVIQATGGREGVKMIINHHPDLVITDLRMPEMPGEQVIHWITQEYRPAYPYVKVIAYSGDDREAVEPVVKAAGSDAFISKPIDLAAFRQVVDALLALP